MIYLYQNKREYDYDVRAIALAFFEREKIVELSREEYNERLTGESEVNKTPGRPLLFLKLEFGDKRIDGSLSEVRSRDEVSQPTGDRPDSRPEGGRPDSRSEGGQSDFRPEGGQPDFRSEGGRPDFRPEGDRPESRPEGGQPDFRPEGDQPVFRTDGNQPDTLSDDEPMGRRVHRELVCDYSDHAHCRNEVCRFLYQIFSDYTGRKLPWGMLTGIRPTKIVMRWLEEGMDDDAIRNRFVTTYLADEQKASLCLEVAKKEKKILDAHPYEKEYSLYIGIPFCPTTCLYCSFASFPVSRFGDRMDPYLTALEKELAFVAGTWSGKPLTTIYVGGGTPTALSEDGLSRLMEMIHRYYPATTLREFTVEAGRPDSVNAKKLAILKDAGVGRISINPQTMHQETLSLIGRDHTVDQVIKAFDLARDRGFDNINMDIITGLPGEDITHIERTLHQLAGMKPESLTVHSLAVKRASHLNIEMERYQGLVKGSTNDMLRMTDEICHRMGMEAYYMYRQKNIPGNLENIGYSLPGRECLYNILIMEERQDIISCGAGGSTKYVFPEENRIERTENVKNIDHYIQRTDEMIERKRRLLEQNDRDSF